MRNIIFTKRASALACTRLTPVFAFLLIATPAFAAPDGCWVRHYDDAHLAKNPAQVVAAMWLSFSTDKNSGTSASLGVAMANQGHVAKTAQADRYLDQWLTCWQDKDRKSAWFCGVECDGGGFQITRDDGKVMEIRTDYLMVGDTEGCGGMADLAERPMTPVTYRLYRADDSQCETN